MQARPLLRDLHSRQARQLSTVVNDPRRGLPRAHPRTTTDECVIDVPSIQGERLLYTTASRTMHHLNLWAQSGLDDNLRISDHAVRLLASLVVQSQHGQVYGTMLGG